MRDNCTPTWAVLGGNEPAVRLDDAFADGQTQAGPADVVGPLDTVEFVEDAGQVFGRDAGATVGHLDLQESTRRYGP